MNTNQRQSNLLPSKYNKLKAMSKEERQAFIDKMKEHRKVHQDQSRLPQLKEVALQSHDVLKTNIMKRGNDFENIDDIIKMLEDVGPNFIDMNSYFFDKKSYDAYGVLKDSNKKPDKSGDNQPCFFCNKLN